MLPDRIHVTGLAVDPVDLGQLFDYVVAAARDKSARRTVGYLNVHVANLAARDALLRQYLNELCDLVYCDGKGIGWGARLQGLSEPPRMTAADWLPDLMGRFKQEDLRVFVIAGKPGVVDRALEELDQHIGGLVGGLDPIGSHDGYVASPEKTASAIDAANTFDADVVLVGMGSPIQEHWVLANRDRINAPVVWALGATFDYYAGEQARGPAWLRKAGHEWAARLIADPGRLWRRYVLGNPQFLWRAFWSRPKKSAADERG
ncbi:putative N-acetylmannosaminyltransferase [Botrimarina colliarenosi]|uniref:Putative N-acetylmannosaminyltransferase n=1 Tax=Botrimarina colliarenosi TaxID=2528001 RepID=A0A5C6APF7_9BACT|nr:WecB/TagA/CpsF family glycosyltransferase [Botrimarina colliarenosi]TWU00054.1 putative N-acetylmannosaminyltransferase [Botrimarina colliarenosi]